MSNSFSVSTFIVKEAMRGLMTRCKVLKSLNTDYSKHFGSAPVEYRKGGSTIYVPKPELGTIRTGWNMDQADQSDSTTPIAIDTVRGADMYFTEAEMFHSIEGGARFSKDKIMPKVSQIAASIDSYCADYMANNIYNVVPVTTIGNAPNSMSYFSAAGRMIKEGLVPEDSPLNCVISPRTEEAIVGAMAGQYNPAQNISDMYTKGQMSKAAGFDWYMSQNMPSHTHGTCTTGTSPAVSGYGVNTLTISGVTSGGTLKAGDSFYLDTCYPVNFETKSSYSQGQRFVCTADTTASGTNITVSVKPDIVISGPKQTVSATPVGKNVTFHQTVANQVVQNDLIFHKDSFALCFGELYKPKGMEMAETFTANGVSVAFVKGFDIKTREQVSRLDVYFGIRPLRLEWAGRIIS
jgi:P22 coat protein - gene protein 5